MKKSQRIGRSVAAVACLSLVIAGCSSSKKSTSPATGNGSATTKGATPTGSPIKIMIAGIGNSTELTLPEDLDAAMAHVQAVNAAGGVNGHPIVATKCDTQDDANVAASCARQAVAADDVAVVSTFDTNGGSLVPILQSAGIPYIDPGLFAPTEFTSPISFPLAGGAPTEFIGVGEKLGQMGCKKGAIISYQQAANATANLFFTAGLKVAGGQVAKIVQVSNGQADFSPAVASLRSSGAQCVGLVVTTPDAVNFLNALHESQLHILVGSNSNVLDPNLIATEGANANGVIEIGAGHIPSDNVPGVTAALAEIKKYQPKSPRQTGLSLEAWAASYVLLNDALPTINGPVTAAAVSKALSSLTAAGTNGIFAPINFTTPNSVAAFARVFNTQLLAWKIENGVPQATGSFFPVSLSVLG